MTEQEQIMSIADLDGWLNVHKSGRLDGQLIGYPPSGLMKYQEIPHYLISRDAIVPVLFKCLFTDKSRCHFIEQLRQLVPGLPSQSSYHYEEIFSLAFIPGPAQISEALLRATGKWKE